MSITRQFLPMREASVLIGALVCFFTVESFPYAQDATAPSSYASPQSIGDLVPASIKLQADGQWDTAGVAQASAGVAQAKNHPATFQVQVESVNPSGPGHGGGYLLHVPDGKIDIHGTTINYRLWVYTTPDQSAAAEQLQPGATVTVSGTIGRSDLNIYSLGRVFLSLVLNDVKIVNGAPDASTGSAPTLPPPPAPAPIAVTPASTPFVVPPRPVTNSLGVKFVPAGTPGVLFSIWDVRLKDFRAFVGATGFDNRGAIISLQAGVWKKRNNSWKEPGFSQSDDDPVVGIDENDAAAFCLWLTKKEQTEGVLPQNQAYRLPTDEEWLAAAGSTKYAWGDAWPPPAGAGNFAGKEARDADWQATDSVLDGYTDNFPRTSPVGSFNPNTYGLYDMGGDVDQICSRSDRTWNLRGCSWRCDTQDSLLLSYLKHVSHVTRITFTGFRMVLAASSGTPSTSPSPPTAQQTPTPPITTPFGTLSPSPQSAPISTPAAPAPPTSKLTEDQARAVVLITGDNAEGTGFLIKTADGPFVVTNLHVIGNNANYKITTNSGAILTVVSAKAASDRDLVMIAIKDGTYNYLDVCPDISQAVQPGDEVITPGNSEGGEVMLNTDGKVLGIGPERIEFDNPIYHGNSGGPVFHTKSGKVLGVVTEAMKVDTTDELDKASFANRASAIGHSMRYFGLRLDTVSAWVPLDFRRFQTESIFLDQFDERTRALDSYLNAPDDKKPEDNLWRNDEKIVKATNDYFEQVSGADASQRMDATRVLFSQFGDIAELDLATMEAPSNFYSFDQQRAKDEAAYRKALKTELDSIGNDVSRMGSLPRSNN